MIKKHITYTDYNGVERTEDFFFNLTKPEIIELELGVTGGLSEMLQKIINTKDIAQLMRFFKKIVLMSYGEKSPDGKRFVKSEEISKAFSETEAYTQIYMELVSDSEKAAEFVHGIVPKDLDEAAAKMQKDGTLPESLSNLELV